ncbi:MAG: DUF4157 domain-containing protein [Desulfobacter sp.]|nr:MAG: DUF4157 domain-containing protein [Desulfobacter sp.]
MQTHARAKETAKKKKSRPMPISGRVSPASQRAALAAVLRKKAGPPAREEPDRHEREAERISAAVHHPPRGPAAAFPDISRLPHPPGPVPIPYPAISLSGGRPLSRRTRLVISRRLPFDFSGVTVHDSPRDRQAAAGIKARAFTLGRHIWLGPGESESDIRLMAHELAHVAQQGAAPALDRPAGQPPARAAGAPITPAPVHIQRSPGEGGGESGPGLLDRARAFVDDAAQWGADRIRAFVASVAPPALVSFLREISGRGIVPYLRERLTRAAAGIFNRITDSSPVLESLFSLFTRLGAEAAEIIPALAGGNCRPLFNALTRLRGTLSRMAGGAWSVLRDFFRPIGNLIAGIRSALATPVMAWLRAAAGDVWEFISGLGSRIWAWTAPVRQGPAAVWNWVRDRLGITGGGGQGGITAWVTQKTREAWEGIREGLGTMAAPVQQMADRIGAILPLDGLLSMRERVNAWRQSADRAAAAMDEQQGGSIIRHRERLRERLLPAITGETQSLRAGIAAAGDWVAGRISGLAHAASAFLQRLAAAPVIGLAAGPLQWLQRSATRLSGWAQNAATTVFGTVNRGLSLLLRFIRPVSRLLNRVAETLGDLLGRLQELVMDPLWADLPRCIINPVKDFLIRRILSRIPLFNQLTGEMGLWDRAREAAMEILNQIFVDGNVMGGLRRFWERLLSLAGIPARLAAMIFARSTEAFSHILMDPGGFLSNLLRALRLGFSRFFGNIIPLLTAAMARLEQNLLAPLTEWINRVIIARASPLLLSLLDVTGITPVINALTALYRAIESLSAHLGRILDILGTILENTVEIARGGIARAGTALVNALSGAIPIIIQFLASLLGLGDIGRRLMAIIRRAANLVHRPLDRLIVRAIRIAGSFRNQNQQKQ